MLMPSSGSADTLARLTAAPARDEVPTDCTTSSLRVFHAPQPGHLPYQRGLSYPHSEQTYVLLAFAIFFTSVKVLYKPVGNRKGELFSVILVLQPLKVARV